VIANQYATVKVNGVSVNAHCTPDESCGTVWYSCVSELDVSSYRAEPLGGSLAVEVSVTGVNSGVCDYLGYPLYTRMYLRETLPTGEPTHQPSSEPSSEPTAEPSSCPSGGPSSQPSGQPTALPTSVPTGEPTGEPSGEPTGEPTSGPSSEPSGEPSGQPTQTPTGQPTGQPTDMPTGQPTGVPSGEPSAEPTGQPTSHPTMVYPQSFSYSAGGDVETPVLWNVDSLGFVNNPNPLYLSVDIYPTNYEVIANQYATVKVNGVSVNAHCTPDESCGTVWYSCVSELDVSSYRAEPLGGSLAVEVSVTGVNSGVCDYLGYPLYTRMYLREALPTGQPTTIPSGEPSGQPTGEPTDTPSAIPTAVPTAQPSSAPTSRPTGEPTVKPTGEPTGMPSSSPTLSFPLTYEAEMGGIHNVSFSIRDLGFVNRSTPKFLSVGVWPTNYDDKASKWAIVKINDEVIVPYCIPQQSCGTRFHYCVADMDVLPYVNSSLGGSFTVDVITSGVFSGPCDHEGHPLYARVFLTEIMPTSDEYISIWIFVAACVGFCLLLILVIWLIFAYKQRQKRLLYAANCADVEMGKENEDICDENDEIPGEDRMRVKPVADEAYRRHLRQVAVIEETPHFSAPTPSPNPSPQKRVPPPVITKRTSSGISLDGPKSPLPPISPSNTGSNSHIQIQRTVSGMAIIDSLDS